MPITRNTITDIDQFKHELATIRQQGFAVDRGEALIETGCVAAPIFELMEKLWLRLAYPDLLMRSLIVTILRPAVLM